MKNKLYTDNESQTWSESDPFTVERYEQFSQYFDEALTILDIGCNTGRGGAVIKNKYPSITLYGIDLISERIAKIPPGIYENVFNESITNFDFGELKFDRIIAGELIEHIPKEEFLLLLDRCNQLLKDSGLILFTTPNPNSFLVKFGRDAVFKDPSHVNIMSISEFKNVVKQAGLKIIKVTGSGKVTRYIGSKIPIINLYGSYLAVLSK